MKMITVNVQLPEAVDNHFRKQAEKRFVTKSVVIREVLIEHVEKIKQQNRETQPA